MAKKKAKADGDFPGLPTPPVLPEGYGTPPWITAKTASTKSKRVSTATAQSLDALKHQLELAEEHLSKMPAATLNDVRIDLGDLVGDPRDQYNEIEWTLLFVNGNIEVWKCRDHGEEGIENLESKRIADFPTRVRLEIANRVPDLIRRAKEAESEIKTRSDEITSAIALAMEDTMEVDE